MMEFAKRSGRMEGGSVQQVFEVCVSQGQMRTGRGEGGGHVGDLLFIGGLNVAL